MKKIRLFNVNFDALTMNETVQLIEKKIKKKEPTHLLGVNADKINEMDNNEKLRQSISRAHIINADGASVIIASKILKRPLPERVAGIDLMQELLTLANSKGYSVYFLGAKKNIVEKMIKKIEIKYRNLNIYGYRDGYFKKDQWSSISEDIKEKSPDLVFIGITSPTKEYLIDFFLDKDIPTVFMGVGGSFDVLSGEIKRAPELIQKLNMEWVYRVIQEPKRLFKRYFFGNIYFLMKLKEEIKKNK